MISVEDFTKTFPPGNVVPEMLLRLLEFQNDIQDWYSGYFELVASQPGSMAAWFDGDQEAANQFVEFAVNSDGSSYCFWLYNKELTIEAAPIVFLGSEGVDNAVLANNLRDFFALLAVGYEELGFKDGRLEKLISKENLKFRKWLKTEFNIEPPVDAEKQIAAAQDSHPDLNEWVSDWQKAHYGN